MLRQEEVDVEANVQMQQRKNLKAIKALVRNLKQLPLAARIKGNRVSVEETREFGALAPSLICNGDFAPVSSVVRFCPHFIETNALFAPLFNTVRCISGKIIKINWRKIDSKRKRH